MVIFYINVYIITRDFVLFNPCKIGQATYGARLNSYNADRAPYDAERCPAGHQPMLLFTDAGRRPYDM